MATGTNGGYNDSLYWTLRRGDRTDGVRGTNQLWFWTVSANTGGGRPLPQLTDHGTNFTHSLAPGESLDWWQLATPAQTVLQPAQQQIIPLFRTHGTATTRGGLPKEAFLRVRCEPLPAGLNVAPGQHLVEAGLAAHALLAKALTTTTASASPPALGPRLQFRLIAETNDPSAELLADLRGKQRFRVQRNILLDDAAIAEAKPNDEGPNTAIDVTFTVAGGKRFAEITSANRGKQLATIFDGKVLFAPLIHEACTSGSARIHGDFTLAEARTVVRALMAKAAPRFKALVACFNGKVDSGSSCSGHNFQPDGTIHPKGMLTCRYPGKVSEVEWAFVEQRGDQDVYRFTRRFPADTAATATTTKVIEFSDSRVVVFEDEFQAVVIGPPENRKLIPEATSPIPPHIEFKVLRVENPPGTRDILLHFERDKTPGLGLEVTQDATPSAGLRKQPEPGTYRDWQVKTWVGVNDRVLGWTLPQEFTAAEVRAVAKDMEQRAKSLRQLPDGAVPEFATAVHRDGWKYHLFARVLRAPGLPNLPPQQPAAAPLIPAK